MGLMHTGAILSMAENTAFFSKNSHTTTGLQLRLPEATNMDSRLEAAEVLIKNLFHEHSS